MVETNGHRVAGRTTLRPNYDYGHYDAKMTSERNAERAARTKVKQETGVEAEAEFATEFSAPLQRWQKSVVARALVRHLVTS